ncbi:hypothetical protein [Flavobacterium sp.]|uniref:hypothetical protein n=1 Tax=Flavobacterium sp. TaxID=239 RepID=UPI00262970BD|nr:hypothetical protein [Flavobacterium sp.]
MSAYDIRFLGGFVIWIFKGFKGSLQKSVDNNYIISFVVGLITVIIVFLVFYLLYAINFGGYFY